MGCDMSMHDNSDRQEQIREQAMRQWEEEQAREQEDLTRPAMVSSSASKDVGAKVAKGAFLVLVGSALVWNFVRPSGEEAKQLRQERAQAKQSEPSSTEVPPAPEQTAGLSPEQKPEVSPAAAGNMSDKSALSAEQQAEIEHRKAEEEEKRRKAEAMRLARLKSEIIVKPASDAGSSAGLMATAGKLADGKGGLLPVSASSSEEEGDDTPAEQKPKNGQYGYDRNMRFMQETKGRDEVAYARQLGSLNYVALEGKFLDATLETQVTSTLPGKARAILSEPLYSEKGIEVLPRGTRLIGIYNTSIRKGQDLIFMAWRRAIRPDGIEVMLDSVGTNALGRSGMSGEVNNHYAQIFGTAALLSIIGAGTSMHGKGSESYGSAAQYRSAVTESFAQQANTIMQPYAAIEPTINVHQGEIVKVFLQRDIDFTAVLAPKTPKKGQGALLLP